MLITAIEHGLDLAKSYGKRGEGVHMSDLYGALYAALEPKRYAKKVDAPPPKERWAVGMAFEEMLEEGLKRRIFNENEHETITRPGEFETEHTIRCPRPKRRRTKGCGCVCGGGVLYSPDLLIFNGSNRSGEIKLNTMSAKGAPWKLGKTYSGFDKKFDKYFCQIKTYNYHLGTTLGRLYSCSLREMVYFNEKDIFRSWNIDFKQRELVEEWQMVLNFGVSKGLLTS